MSGRSREQCGQYVVERKTGSPLLMTKSFLEEVSFEPGPGRTAHYFNGKNGGGGGNRAWRGASISNYAET